jgi:hypothetical protein
MESEVSLPCSQQPATGPYPGPYDSSPHLPILFTEVHVNIIVLSSLGLQTIDNVQYNTAQMFWRTKSAMQNTFV